jgi:hypothetical protein
MKPGQQRRRYMAQRSDKMRRVYDGGGELGEGRRALVVRLLEERPWCEVCQSLKASENPDAIVCRSADIHEILTRARGGSILDESNLLAVCRAHHMRIHRSPTWAAERGFLRKAKGETT